MNPIREKVELNLKKPKIMEIEPKSVIYIRFFGEYKNLDFGSAWKRLWGFVKQEKLFTAKIEHIAIYHNDPKITEAEKLQTDICLTIHKSVTAKDGIGVATIERGKYAVFTYIGSYDYLGEVYDHIFSEWLPSSGMKLADSACFEKYCNNPADTAPEKLRTEIYVPVQ